MKLCIVTPSFSGGGAEKVAVNLANQYAENGIDVSLLVFINSGPYKDQLSRKVKLIDLDVARARYGIFKLGKVLAKESPSHIISVIRDVSILVGLVLPKSLNCIVAYREANTMHSVRRLPAIKRLIFKLLMKASYRKANLIIANSEDTKEDLIKNGIVSHAKVKVIRNPVIPSDINLRASEVVDNEWLGNGYKVLLNIGRLHPQKNQALLIEAFSKVLERHLSAKLLILGEGSEMQALLNQIDSLGLQGSIRILPFQKNPFPYYRASDLFVLTSDWEGFGNILVEALACGTPVVSTDCPGGPRSILGNGKFGTLVPSGHADSLAKAIIEQLNQPNRWDRVMLEARGHEYTVKAVAAEYLDHITKENRD